MPPPIPDISHILLGGVLICCSALIKSSKQKHLRLHSIILGTQYRNSSFKKLKQKPWTNIVFCLALWLGHCLMLSQLSYVAQAHLLRNPATLSGRAFPHQSSQSLTNIASSHFDEGMTSSEASSDDCRLQNVDN